jgi:OOP family OmpA-OmpF porin
MKFNIIAIAAAAIFSSTAYADGLYVEGNLGSATLKIDGVSDSKSDTSYTLGAGYKFGQYFAAEAGYSDFGTAKWSGAGWAQIKTSGFYLGPAVTLPLTEKLSLTGRAGWIRLKADYSDSFGSSDSGNETDTYYGIGASYAIDNNWSATVGYNKVNLDGADLSTLTVGAKYSF